jgi:hypothetical protein
MMLFQHATSDTGLARKSLDELLRGRPSLMTIYSARR